ncbi:hypothetical protein D3OALGA1CA_3928 [Olavius algarvensis associated proteobacterium Delta 3]|nr:hypothetical protein D3OALGB2SA_2124 [Olavius algarvensis associated proteobacterium Delta 3]CAB5142362.1 hypothetical protein D3OALGA1CA_3928 [Olavius algarvensis associated proteobacterium Delta 3]
MPVMRMSEKKDLILQYEELQAQILAGRVIFKPPLTAWYILMPLIFIYYFYRLQKYSQSRKDFVHNYMLSRRRALEEVADAVETHRPPDIDSFREFTTVPAEATPQYIAWIRVLVDHYTDLLRCDGTCCEDLIRSAYDGRGNYLLFLNRLNRIEHKLNRALTPGLEVDIPDVMETITLMETQVEQMRRAEAERIFP